jgi:hypothetical protein
MEGEGPAGPSPDLGCRDSAAFAGVLGGAAAGVASHASARACTGRRGVSASASRSHCRAGACRTRAGSHGRRASSARGAAAHRAARRTSAGCAGGRARARRASGLSDGDRAEHERRCSAGNHVNLRHLLVSIDQLGVTSSATCCPALPFPDLSMLNQMQAAHLHRLAAVCLTPDYFRIAGLDLDAERAAAARSFWTRPRPLWGVCVAAFFRARASARDWAAVFGGSESVMAQRITHASRKPRRRNARRGALGLYTFDHNIGEP